MERHPAIFEETQHPPDTVDVRQPVLTETEDPGFELAEIDRQWLLISEAVRQECLSDPALRKALLKYIAEPVSENLPSRFLNDCAAVSPRVARLIDRYEEQTGTYLDLPAVPDEALVPDITHAPRHTDPAAVRRNMEQLDYPPEKIASTIDSYDKEGKFTNGITAEERLLVAKRYRLARDVKMLSLMSELSGLETRPEPGSNGEIILPSGVRISVAPDNDTFSRDALDPHGWVKRRQIKDRVYEATIGTTEYILKERKTNRHTDTKRHGHRPGLTSAEEYAVGREMHDRGAIDNGEIKVSWENPVGCVTFPDGFQASVFEREPGLEVYEHIGIKFSDAIVEQSETYETELREIYGLAMRFYDSPEVVQHEHGRSESALTAIVNRLRPNRKTVPGLSLQEYARVKCFYLIDQAQDLLYESTLRQGYGNSDIDGYAFRLNRLPDGRIGLEIIGFDYEYYNKLSASEQRDRLARHQTGLARVESLDFLQWSGGTAVTRMERAVYLAMRYRDSETHD